MTPAHLDRVLDVLDTEQWLTTDAIRDTVRMDTTMCGWTLTHLTDTGVIERTSVRTARWGKPAQCYRLAKRGRTPA